MNELMPTATIDATNDGMYVAVAHDRMSGRTLVGLDERAAGALLLMAEHFVANFHDVLDGSMGLANEDAADVANAADLIYGLLKRA